MNANSLSGPQWRRLAEAMVAKAKTLPSWGSYEPWYDATRVDRDEIYASVRGEATSTREEVMHLVGCKPKGEGWGQGKYREKFWLSARWSEAISQALEFAESSEDMASFDQGCRIKAKKAMEWLLWVEWDRERVDHWLAEHLAKYVHFDQVEGFPEDFVDYSLWLRDVKAGHYRRLE